MQLSLSTIDRFSFDPTTNCSFESWYKRYEDVWTEDAKDLDDAGRARLVVHRLDAVAHKRYSDYILPAVPKDKSFKETVTILTGLFKRAESQFCLRWKCLQVEKKGTEDYTAYTARVNKLCEECKINQMTPDQFKCLIFILGLKNPNEADIGTRLHNKLYTDTTSNSPTLVSLGEEANRLMNLKHDTKLGTNSHCDPYVRNVNVNHGKSSKTDSDSDQQDSDSDYSSSDRYKIPKYPCWNCGAMHFRKDCNYLSYVCGRCNATGHKEGYCNVGDQSRKKVYPKTNVLKVKSNGTKPSSGTGTL